MTRADYLKECGDIPSNWGTRRRLLRYVELTQQYMQALEKALEPLAECVAEGSSRAGITQGEANHAYDVLSFGKCAPPDVAQLVREHLAEDQAAAAAAADEE